MKTLSICTIFVGLISVLHAQSYTVPWFKIAGGGGLNSTGGVYSVSGTIGQHDAGGPMTNGQYSVTGGFWVWPQAVQVDGAPTLTIAAGGAGQATISWAPNPPGFILQETWSLSPPSWTNSISASTNPVTIPTANAMKFYRLANP